MRINNSLRFLPVIAALFLAPLAPSAWAWNDTAHKTIALIAWQELTPAVRARITELLKKHPQYATQIQTQSASEQELPILDFMTASTWADKIRNDAPANRPFNHDNWHTTVFPFITGSLPSEKQPLPWSETWQPGGVVSNIIQALKKSSADIRDPKSTDDQKAVALTWMAHLVGDIHQPLHTTSWYSEEHPDGEGDKRGNYTFVNTGNSKVTLHSYWDGFLSPYVDLNSSSNVVARLKRDFPRDQFADQLKDTDFKHWALDGHEFAKSVAYMSGLLPHGLTARDNIPALSKAYQDEAKALGLKRLTLAGYRLADQLNQLLAPATPSQ